VRSAIDSVLRQTLPDLEVIVVDDGSSDETVNEIDAIADSRVNLIVNSSNAGPAEARNVGARLAKSSWLAFHDSDDLWLPWKLERQLDRLHATTGSAVDEPVGAYCGLLVVADLDDDRGSSERRHAPVYIPDPSLTLVEGRILPSLLRTSVISTQTLVVRRAVFSELGGFDPAANGLEDWDFAIRLAARGPIAFVDEPLVYQRMSPNSFSRDSARRVRAARYVVEKHLDRFSAYPDLLARQYFIIAGGCRRLGDVDAAREYLRLSRSLRRYDPKVNAMAGVLALMSLRQRTRLRP
jgi:glycosyltransferase involved in cell wall biosynthesis